jgi:hypothetical protein
MSKAEREVVSLLYNSDHESDAPRERTVVAIAPRGNEEEDSDEDAPPLEEEAAGEAGTDPSAEGLKSLEHGVIVEEGDELPEDFVVQMMAGDDDDDGYHDGGAGGAGGPARASRLVDEQFEAMLRKYDESEMGELPDEHPGLQGRSSVTNYYDILDQYIAACGPAKAEREARAAPAGEEEEGEPAVDEEERCELAAKTRALALLACEEGSEEEEEDVAPEEHEAWDCESILSTYSNLYNHPAQIRDARAPPPTIRIDPRTGAPRLPEPPGAAAPAAAQAAAPRCKAPAAGMEGHAEEGEGEGEEEEEEEEEAGGRRGGSRGAGAGELARRKEETKEEKAARKLAAKETKARALEKRREDKAARSCKGTSAKPNAFDPRARSGVSVRHLA